MIKKIRAGATIRCVMRDWDSAFTLPSLILTKNGEVEASPKSYTEINYVSILFSYSLYSSNPRFLEQFKVSKTNETMMALVDGNAVINFTQSKKQMKIENKK